VSAPRFACLWVPHFTAAALVRSDPSLLGRPVAAIVGPSTTRSVLEVTPDAWAGGVRPGMNVGEAETRVPGLVCRARDLTAERSATAALLDLAVATSPRVELAAPDRVHLDLAGLAHLYASEAALGERLALGAASLELPARVGLAGTRTVAQLATRAAAGVSVVPAGQEAGFLAPLPVTLLGPAPELAEALERWGIRTLGEVATLSAPALLARLGVPGVRLRSLARGEDDGPFVPQAAVEPWSEALALDWEVTQLEGLLFVLRRLLERLAARLALRERGATALHLVAGLADGTEHRRRLPLEAPLREPRALLGLCRVELEPLTLPAPIVAVAVEAETAPLCPAQPDLYLPKRPSPHELARTLGELVALVGAERVGAPALGDTHRPTAIGLSPFTGDVARRAAAAALAFTDAATLACRRFSPPLPATVACAGESPRRVDAPGLGGAVLACAGPWRTAGEWWADTAWSREEWDVALSDGVVYRLVLDRATGGWSIDAVYD
jgi:protein ImuB